MAASGSVTFSPLMAARATFALNAGLWFRRVRFVIVSLLIRSHPGRCQAETPLIRLLKFAEPALTASGTVYGLSRREDFAGAYVQIRPGRALGDQGKGTLWLHND